MYTPVLGSTGGGGDSTGRRPTLEGETSPQSAADNSSSSNSSADSTSDDDDPFADNIVGGIGGGYTGGFDDPTGGGSASADADVTDTGDPDATEDDIPERGWGGIHRQEDGDVVDTTPNQDQTENVASPEEYDVDDDPGYAGGSTSGQSNNQSGAGGQSGNQPSTGGQSGSGLPTDFVALNDQAIAGLAVVVVGLAVLAGR